MHSYRNIFLILGGLSYLVFQIISTEHNLLVQRHFYDFHAFYQGAQFMLNGTNLYQEGYIYPPFFAFLITPLTTLSITNACQVWKCFNFILLMLILYFSSRRLTSLFQPNISLLQIFAVCSLALLLTYEEIGSALAQNQSDLLILTGVALGLYFLKSKPYLAGLCLGIVAKLNTKHCFFCHCSFFADVFVI